MSDHDEEKGAEEPIPEGMVRKKRRVRKRRRSQTSSASSKEDANKLFAKAKDLLIGMHDEDEDFGHVDVAEQVRRLKKKKEDDRPLDDVWGTKKKSSAWLWIVLVGVISSVVAVVVGLTIWSTREDGDEDISEDWKPPVIGPIPLQEDGLTWFYEDSVSVIEEAKRTVEMINNNDEMEFIEKRLRNSPFREDFPVDLREWGSPLLTNSLSGFQWDTSIVYSSEATGSKERGYISLAGRRENGNPYEIFFVTDQEGRVVLDWDASMGWSEMSIGEMARTKPRNEIFLRCKVGKDPSFDQKFGEDDFSGYVLSGDTVDEFVFAFVNLKKPGGKSMDRDFKLLLNYGSFVSDAPPLVDQKVTLRVRFDTEIGSEGQFEIVEYLNDGWVTP